MMRDRLIKIVKDSLMKNIDYTHRLAENITDDLLANGVIVPPCKVGDTVYVVSQGAGFSVVWNVYKATAKAIHLDRWGQLFIRVETDKENIGGYVEIERVFLTREEAEMALKGGVE